MPTTPDPYLQAASEAVGGPSDDTLRELVAAQDAAREVAPDEAQKAYRQAAREQMPFGMALDRLRADPKREGHDWQKLAKDAPTLARVVAEDDGFAAAAQRDVEKLSRLEQLVRGVKNSRGAELAKTAGKALEGATSAPEAVYHRAAQGRRVDQIGSLAWQQVMGDASPEVEKLVAELEKANSAAWNPKLGFVAGMAPAAAEQLAMMTGRLERSADLAIGGLLGGAAAGAAAGSAALGVGAVPGAAAGSLAFNDPVRFLSTTTALLESSTAATSGTDTAFTLRPLVELSGADRILDVVDHAGTSRFYVTPAGSIVNSGSATLGTVSSALYGVAGDNPVVVRGSKVDGASAVGVRVGNLNTLTTAGSKVAAFCADNPTTCASEVASIGYDGAATFAGRVSGAGVQAVAGTEPTCDESARGLIWTVAGGAGVADTVKVCAKDAGDAFAWRTIY